MAELGTRPTLSLATVNPELDALLERARGHVMTPAERESQRKSWVIGELMLDDETMTREEAERLYDQAGRTFGFGGPDHG